MIQAIFSVVSITALFSGISKFCNFSGANKYESIFFSNAEKFWKRIVDSFSFFAVYIFIEIVMSICIHSLMITDLKGINCLASIIAFFLLVLHLLFLVYDEKKVYKRAMVKIIDWLVYSNWGYTVCVVLASIFLGILGANIIELINGDPTKAFIANFILLIWLTALTMNNISFIRKVLPQQKFYFFVKENDDEIKYYIHYADSKGYVLCSKETDINKAEEVRFFKISTVKENYALKCEKVSQNKENEIVKVKGKRKEENKKFSV